MPNVLRVNSLPTIAELIQVPQIVIVDETGPTNAFGVASGIACLVGEFVKGSFLPTEVTSPGQLGTLYGQSVYPYFSQDAAGRQNGAQIGWNGNGLLQTFGKTFRRLGICRVDTEMVTTDGGTTKGSVVLTLTIATADQTAGLLNKDITLAGGARFADTTIGTATSIVALSGDVVIPKGTTVTSNAVSVTVPVFPILLVEPIVATATNTIDTVIDGVIQNVDPGTTISAVVQGAALWPVGTGTTLSARIEARYAVALATTMPGTPTTTAITRIWAARRSSVIRVALAANAAAAAKNARGRIAMGACDPATANTPTAAIAAVTAAVGLVSADNYVQPSDRMALTFPGLTKILVPDLGGIKVPINSDGWMASTLSNLDEEHNPGEENPWMQGIVELEDAFITSPLQLQDYKNLIAAGVCPIQHDSAVGWWFVDGITSANQTNFPTRKPMKRRTMADFIQDTLVIIGGPHQKKPATIARRDTFGAAVTSFLQSLAATDQPAQQRIDSFLVDLDGGNTLETLGAGIYVVIVRVRLLPTMDVIVFRTQIGETVVIPTQVQAAA